MKVAIVFTGFFRTFNFVKQSFTDNVLNLLPEDTDIFFSTPKTLFTKPEDEISDWQHIHSQNDHLVENSQIVDFFGDKLKSYKLIDYSSLPYKKLIKDNNISVRNFANQPNYRIFSQFHNEQLSLKVFKEYVDQNNKHYDLVIMARGDVKYHSKLDLTQFQQGQVNYPSHAMFEGNLNVLPPNARPSPSLEKAFNDQMLFGSQEHILTFMNLYDHILPYYHEGIVINHETMMGIHLRKNGIDWCGKNIILYELWRHSKY